ncbi:tetraacyldisaccharide 4'-kinase [Shewanella sp. A32]|uniref:tetraacyldisaccharide 4'-kinase n=1 Tax=Shewanella sp. A32 TaxID=3031327 RepID=UPI0023B9445F|nr:tetraacyldisaccharide 4'-kinase [Shewanella sp. A32]MDF0534281.1 tetraacyldisaccharide 4'-kinase [Shewanella sp. A32]
METLINRIWYGRHWSRWLLWPLSWLFALISGLRRLAFRLGIKQQQLLPVPVILVGNITVGGSGKTPVVIYLIELLRRQGYRPGVISRGYGSEQTTARMVTADSTPADVGDEPCMIVNRTGVPMAVGSDRIATGLLLLQSAGVDVIISDDGLQHYRLGRALELLVLDAKRGLGNGMLLPAGPLREGAWRLSTVDFILSNGAKQDAQGHYAMTLKSAGLRAVSSLNQNSVPTTAEPITAIAGIGNPQRFFETLQAEGFNLAQTKVFADHHPYNVQDFAMFSSQQPLLMTEKDAVKCRAFAGDNNWWYLAVDAVFSAEFESQLLARVRTVMTNRHE